jgi:hypothetical protein
MILYKTVFSSQTRFPVDYQPVRLAGADLFWKKNTGDWFVLREKYCWLVTNKPNEHNVHRDGFRQTNIAYIGTDSVPKWLSLEKGVSTYDSGAPVPTITRAIWIGQTLVLEPEKNSGAERSVTWISTPADYNQTVQNNTVKNIGQSKRKNRMGALIAWVTHKTTIMLLIFFHVKMDII